MKQYKELRDGFKNFINENVVVSLNPIKEAKPSVVHSNERMIPKENHINEIRTLALKIKRKNELIDKLGADGRELLKLIEKDGEIDSLTKNVSLLYKEYEFTKGKAFDLVDMLLEVVKMPFESSKAMSTKDAFDSLCEWLRVLVKNQERVYVSIEQVNEMIQKAKDDATPKDKKFTKGEFNVRNVNEGIFSDLWNNLKMYVAKTIKLVKSYDKQLDKIMSLLS